MQNTSEILRKNIADTPFIDTHNHLTDESDRLACIELLVPCDDWAILLDLYFRFDLVSSGMPKDKIDVLFSRQIDPIHKWEILKAYWPFIKNTASGLVFRYTIKILYGIDEIAGENIGELQCRYEETRSKGFYGHIIRNVANIKCCHVLSRTRAFSESEYPEMLFYDIVLNDLIRVSLKPYSVPENFIINILSDWHSLIDWWFNNYGHLATGVKIGNAYFRRLNFVKESIENLDEIFHRKINSQIIDPKEEKQLQDHLFWYCVEHTTKKNLPVKLHTGQWAMPNAMDMNRVKENPADCAALCRQSPQTRFVFFHIGYPYYEEMLSLAKNYTNAYIDMCWAWSINPMAAKDFLKKFIITVPNNKIFAFGSDDCVVENIVGHAALARKGISAALSELVNENWLTLSDAMELAERIMYKNAEDFYGHSFLPS